MRLASAMLAMSSVALGLATPVCAAKLVYTGDFAPWRTETRIDAPDLAPGRHRARLTTSVPVDYLFMTINHDVDEEYHCAGGVLCVDLSTDDDIDVFEPSTSSVALDLLLRPAISIVNEDGSGYFYSARYAYILAGIDTFESGASGTWTLTISPQAVPETATWILLLLGFGTVGCMARRHRSDCSALSGRAGAEPS